MFSQKKNSFIHGTTTASLSILERTNYTLMEPIEMIDRYGVAPVTGELNSRGGYRGHLQSYYPRFGRCSKSSYNLNKIIENYTIPSRNRRTNFEYLRHLINWGSTCAYSNINLIIIYATRCQQERIDISQLVNSELIEKMKEVKNLTGTEFPPNFDANSVC